MFERDGSSSISWSVYSACSLRWRWAFASDENVHVLPAEYGQLEQLKADVRGTGANTNLRHVDELWRDDSGTHDTSRVGLG